MTYKSLQQKREEKRNTEKEEKLASLNEEMQK